MIAALRRVLEKAPPSVDPAALLKVATAMADLLEHSEGINLSILSFFSSLLVLCYLLMPVTIENVRVAAAKTLAVYAKVAPAEQFDTFFKYSSPPFYLSNLTYLFFFLQQKYTRTRRRHVARPSRTLCSNIPTTKDPT
jgi:hypothetical protein